MAAVILGVLASIPKEVWIGGASLVIVGLVLRFWNKSKSTQATAMVERPVESAQRHAPERRE